MDDIIGTPIEIETTYRKSTRFERIDRSDPRWEGYRKVRTVVFVEEQGVALNEEFDAQDSDEITQHFVLEVIEKGTDFHNQQVVGVLRFQLCGTYVKLERVALLKEFRGGVLGQCLVNEGVNYFLKNFQGKILVAHAQTAKLRFYERLGFIPISLEFFEKLNDVVIPHKTMVLPAFGNSTMSIHFVQHSEYEGDCFDQKTVARIERVLGSISFIPLCALAQRIPDGCGLERNKLIQLAFQMQNHLLKQSGLLKDINYPNEDIIENQSVSTELENLSKSGWKMLNIGFYSSVPECWRIFYTITKFCDGVWKAFVESDYETALRAIDDGLLMGRRENLPYEGLLLTKIADHIHNRLQRLELRWDSLRNNNVEAPKERTFVKPWWNIKEMPKFELSSVLQCLDSGMPCVIRKFAKNMTAFEKWSFSYLSSIAGGRTVPVEIGSRYDDEDWSQTLMTIDEFLEDFVLSSDQLLPGYLAQHRLFTQIPQLFDDIDTKEVEMIGKDIDWNVWFGPAGTISSFHHDPRDNLFIQIVGSKFLRLAHPSDTNKLYPRDDILKNTSQIDGENPDLNSYPLFSEAQTVDVIVNPGDAVLIPKSYWHFVKSLTPSMSVSAWFDPLD
ncbi:unnamed protein product, partial [Mesorhabditis belari]|uniref:Uncharacterized protein n=1 Tax=Mesorhabditis belari TaxID=2138241 RepID=A0AAF3F670_9BILA